MHGAPTFGCARTSILCIAFALALLLGALSEMVIPTGETISAANPPSNTAITGLAPRTFLRRLGSSATAQPHVGQPVRLKIPAINVDAPVEDVGQAPDGAMDVPKDFNDTAWYDLGARPGERGNAVVAGHVDSTTGRAVFWDLHKLVSGDQIVVVGDDGVERQFVVTALEAYARADVPLDRIFGPTTETHLNVITCDANSVFDQTRKEYGGNLVVYARAAS